MAPVIEIVAKVPWKTVGKYAAKGAAVAGAAAAEAVFKGIFKKEIETKVADLDILNKLKGAKD